MDCTPDQALGDVEAASVETRDGLKFAAWRWLAKRAAPRTRVALAHGYAEPAGRYGTLGARGDRQ